MSYPRPTYTLSHAGVALLILDTTITPPFLVGEELVLQDDRDPDISQHYVVERLTRLVPYHRHTEDLWLWCVPLPGQEITVHLVKKESP